MAEPGEGDYIIGDRPAPARRPLRPTGPMPQPPLAGMPLPMKREVEKAPKHSAFYESKLRSAKKFAEEFKKATAVSVRNEVENRGWKPLNMVRANLVREQRNLFFNWRSKILGMVFSSSLAALIVVVAYGALIIWERDKKQNNQYIFDNVLSVQKQITSEEARMAEVDDFNNRLLYVAYLLDNHVYWSNFFKLMENRTTPDTYFEVFSGDLKGSFTMPGVARDNRAMSLESRVLQNFGDPRISKAEPDNMKPYTAAFAAADQTTPGGQTVSGPTLPVTTPSAAGTQLAPGVADTRIRFDMKLDINPKMLLYKCYVGAGETISGHPVKESDSLIQQGDQYLKDNDPLVKQYCPYF